MSFTSAIAGPSRLPYRAITAQSAGAVRYYASAESSSEAADSTNRDSAGSAPDVSANFYGAEKKGRGRIRGMTYTLWKRTVGRDMEHPQPGKKAQWLGGDVPYPMNPSFRPPPPLGNEVQERLYREIKSGKRTLGEISADWNVGIARLDAIRKLKEIEAEYKRQSLPLQTAYQEAMEPLLGSRTLVSVKWSRGENGAERAESTEASVAEADEERRFMAGIGDGGAFGNRNKVEKGAERSVFEWRGEDEFLDAKAAGLEEAFPTPDTEKARRRAAVKAAKAHKAKAEEIIVPTQTPTTTWRFRDLSKVGVQQHHQVLTAMEKRERMAEKKRVRKNRNKGIFQ